MAFHETMKRFMKRSWRRNFYYIKDGKSGACLLCSLHLTFDHPRTRQIIRPQINRSGEHAPQVVIRAQPSILRNALRAAICCATKSRPSRRQRSPSQAAVGATTVQLLQLLLLLSKLGQEHGDVVNPDVAVLRRGGLRSITPRVRHRARGAPTFQTPLACTKYNIANFANFAFGNDDM